MKTSNVQQGRAHHEAIIRGWVASTRAGGTGVSVGDGTTVINGVTSITVVGDGSVIQNPDGSVTIFIGGDAAEEFLTRLGGENPVVTTDTSVGGTKALDLSSANIFDLTLVANTTFSFTNPPDETGEWKIILRQGGSGSYTATWPAELGWQDTDGTTGGSAPTLFTAVGAIDVIQIVTLDGGTTYGGASVRASGSAGASATDAFVWRPVIDTGSGAVIFDSGTGNAIMAFTAI